MSPVTANAARPHKRPCESTSMKKSISRRTALKGLGTASPCRGSNRWLAAAPADCRERHTEAARVLLRPQRREHDATGRRGAKASSAN